MDAVPRTTKASASIAEAVRVILPCPVVAKEIPPMLPEAVRESDPAPVEGNFSASVAVAESEREAVAVAGKESATDAPPVSEIEPVPVEGLEVDPVDA